MLPLDLHGALPSHIAPDQIQRVAELACGPGSALGRSILVLHPGGWLLFSRDSALNPYQLYTLHPQRPWTQQELAGELQLDCHTSSDETITLRLSSMDADRVRGLPMEPAGGMTPVTPAPAPSVVPPPTALPPPVASTPLPEPVVPAAWPQEQPEEQPAAPAPSSQAVYTGPLPPDLTAAVNTLLDRGLVIQAIKIVREHMGWSLAESRAVVDGLRMARTSLSTSPPPQTIPPTRSAVLIMALLVLLFLGGLVTFLMAPATPS